MSIKKGVPCFLIDERYIRSDKRYCFVHKYAAVPVQLEMVILQYIIIIISLVTGLFFLVILLN